MKGTEQTQIHNDGYLCQAITLPAWPANAVGRNFCIIGEHRGRIAIHFQLCAYLADVWLELLTPGMEPCISGVVAGQAGHAIQHLDHKPREETSGIGVLSGWEAIGPLPAKGKDCGWLCRFSLSDRCYDRSARKAGLH